MLARFKLSTRILIPGVALVLAFSGIFGWFYPRVKKSMYDAKYLKTRHLVEAAYSVVAHYADAADKGEISQNAATAEQSAAASRELNAQAGQVKQMERQLVLLVEGR